MKITPNTDADWINGVNPEAIKPTFPQEKGRMGVISWNHSPSEKSKENMKTSVTFSDLKWVKMKVANRKYAPWSNAIIIIPKNSVNLLYFPNGSNGVSSKSQKSKGI